jgi:hypothetical protein
MSWREKPKPGDEGHIGPIKGRWVQRNGTGFYAFKIGLKNPDRNEVAKAMLEISERRERKPGTFGERYVAFVDHLRRRVFRR